MKPKLLLGAHVSIAGGLEIAPARGAAIGGTVIQIFTKNQMQWTAPPLSVTAINQFHQAVAKESLAAVVAHDGYLINLASPDQQLLERSRSAFLDEMTRAEQLHLSALIFHPGSHKGIGEQAGIQLIAESLTSLILARPNFQLRLLLESTAGQGTSLGYRFDQLQQILEQVPHSERLGVCLDTCHAFAAGYDIRTRTAYEHTLGEFDRIIGLKNLGAIHLNDSMKPLGSRIDRHTTIGDGQIGLDAFRFLMNDDRLAHVPKILEIPGDLMTFKQNIKLLKSLVNKI
ncbi:MAG: deoxyribonuclease IV [candidate division KSB1 bacterium]|nr:deoxyribonuclease IV [candidate division KSB1 bacterium]